MKKLLLAYYLFLCFTPISVAATAIQDLQNRLAKVNSFHSQFSQIIINSDGTIVQQGAGELWIKRPNLFNWHMISPDESMLISDGQTLWFYNPLVAQVTATWLKNTIFNTPFMLIIRNHATDWAQYWIKQKGDDFELVPKSSTGHVIKQCYITVT
ncbi:outer-membrane lipoprotein carrier protein [Serratia symbiotica str. 'Cinara cedri']|nr:outer-membrane lipoprotein carrier protein [Serratia symbiotica str. 'Cinara cedri']